MNEHVVLNEIRQYIEDRFTEDVTGHDYHHMKRVSAHARLIAEKEGADPFLAEAAGWVHDIGDTKLAASPETALEALWDFLAQLGLDQQMIRAIRTAMIDTSFSKGQVPETLEGKIVQDADRLDAIGAIGIARTFAYGGAKGQPIYDGNEQGKTSIHHFHEKLLKLKDGFHTDTAQQLAEERHDLLISFLDQFYKEW
ncbi:HD domain-containing protein [Thalassobacillus hwangdonensis]|uniref:HD domain-containing protein n=1 Tax=Thalassobacillus hwangdonensis TaxID=546108 RepID=A0ABW3KYW5_9BACI